MASTPVPNELRCAFTASKEDCAGCSVHGVVDTSCSYHRCRCNVLGCKAPCGLASLQLPAKQQQSSKQEYKVKIQAVLVDTQLFCTFAVL